MENLLKLISNILIYKLRFSAIIIIIYFMNDSIILIFLIKIFYQSCEYNTMFYKNLSLY